MYEFITKIHRSTALGIWDPTLLKDVSKENSVTQECEVLDFKQELPLSDAEYATTVRDLVALHNSYGGYLIFGVREAKKDRTFAVVGVPVDTLHIGKMRDMTRAYTGSDIRISINTQEFEGYHLEILHVSKRGLGESPVRFVKNGPDDKPGKPIFRKNDIVFRRLSSNAIAQVADDYDFLYSVRRPPTIDLLAPDVGAAEPLEHKLPDRSFICSRFVGRREDLRELWKWLADDFSRVRLIAGEGGLGKTSLAYHFAEDVASRRVKPYEQVVWLTAKKRQFIPSEDSHREATHTDFEDANSLCKAIAAAHGCVDDDFHGLDTRELLQLALESCSAIPSFIVIDDVDTLSGEDQQRALELGMRTPAKTKILLTTRINFSYSPDNVLKLNGLEDDEFREYVSVIRERYQLPPIKDGKLEYLKKTTGGSPLFTDSLLRLERRGLTLDTAITQWKGQKGIEARKAALQREVQQLTRPAKRILYVISRLKSVSYVELAQIVDYTEQTLGDGLQELAGLFLISAPSIAREARYTVEPNTGLLVVELAHGLGIDHAALDSSAKRARSDAIGLTLERRSSIVGLSIAQAIALVKKGDVKAALEAVTATAKKLSKPHPDLLLAVGRFSLKLTPADFNQASKAFSDAYALGQRKQLLFDLWFECEYARGSLDTALEVVTHAIDFEINEDSRWFERRAQVHVARARRSRSRISVDSVIREVDLAIADLREAKLRCVGAIQTRQMDFLLDQATTLRKQLHAGA